MTHIDNEPGPGRNYGETAILHILHILASFLECKTAIFSNRSLRVILLSITLNFFVTSYNPIAWVVKRTKLNFKKKYFLGHPSAHSVVSTHYTDRTQEIFSSGMFENWPSDELRKSPQV